MTKKEIVNSKAISLSASVSDRTILTIEPDDGSVMRITLKVRLDGTTESRSTAIDEAIRALVNL